MTARRVLDPDAVDVIPQRVRDGRGPRVALGRWVGGGSVKPEQPTELAELVERYALARIALDRAMLSPMATGWHETCVSAADALAAVRNELEDALGVGSELTAAYLRTLNVT